MIQNYFSVKGENNMHYGEFSGDMPMSALQAFGGYMSMGGVATDAVNAAISAGTAPSEIYKSLRSTQFETATPVDYVTALNKLVAYAVAQGKMTAEQQAAFGKATGGDWGSDAVAAQAAKQNGDKIVGDALGGMSTTAKVMIGVGIVGLLAGGYYLYTKND